MAAPAESVPTARGADRPLWPLKDGKTQTTFKSSASFGAARTTGSQRWHVGIDIPAKRGDVVVAMPWSLAVSCSGSRRRSRSCAPDRRTGDGGRRHGRAGTFCLHASEDTFCLRGSVHREAGCNPDPPRRSARRPGWGQVVGGVALGGAVFGSMMGLWMAVRTRKGTA